MIISYTLAPALGAVAVTANIVTNICIFPFAIVLARQDAPISIAAIIACSINMPSVISLMLLLLEEYRKAYALHRSQGLEVLQRRWKMLPELVGVLCFLGSAVTIASLVWMRIRIDDLPRTIIGATTQTFLIAAFSIWGLSSLAQFLFLINIILSDRRMAQQSRSLPINSRPNHSAEMHETSRSVTVPHSQSTDSIDLRPWSSGIRNSHKRPASDTISSLRLSITQVVRPISSKSRLISTGHGQKHYRLASLDSGTGEREIIEDGFDSWDTSAVDAQSRQFVMSTTSLSISHSNTASPSQSNSPLPRSPSGVGRFLETIPASPTTSRPASPGFPSDLELPHYHSSSYPSPCSGRAPRSRSNSPSASFRSVVGRRSRTESPAGKEAHIHPLFRSDSPTSPPSATPGTVVTAAPGAGLVISDRRSIQRIRSGSLPTSSSPLIYSNGLDDMNIIVTSRSASANGNTSPNNGSAVAEVPPEREMTPPIPDWVLSAGPRGLTTGYTRRKGPLVPVSECAELINREGET